jgi:hypothetical protein
LILVYNNKMGIINSKNDCNLSINSDEIKNNIYQTNKKLNETDLDVIEKKKNRDAMMNRLLELF